MPIVISKNDDPLLSVLFNRDVIRDCHGVMNDDSHSIVCYCCVDVLPCGIWTVFEELQDLKLSCLAKALPRTVIQSWADSTKQKYIYAFQRWKSWAAGKPHYGSTSSLVLAACQ